ncbi:unnamed protein product, partial [Prorocentrum cordatum]
DHQCRSLLRREVGQEADVRSPWRGPSTSPWVPPQPHVDKLWRQWAPPRRDVSPNAVAAAGQPALAAGGRGRSRFARHLAASTWSSSLAAGGGLCLVLVWVCWQRQPSAWPRPAGALGNARELERPWSATALVWRRYGGDAGVDHGCRGALDLAIDAPSGVLAAPAASEDECKRKCTDMGLDDCTGIEYHHGADNRCLLWSQPVKGIVVRKGASCLVRAPSGSFTVEADTACGAPDAVHAEVGISPESCQSLCLTTLRARCVAVEHDSKTGGCKIFDEPTGGGHAALGVTCSRFELGAPGESSSSTTVTTSLTLTTSHRIAANNSRNGATEDTTVTSATTATTATTTSTAIEVCQQPTEGGSCYSNVLSTMRVAKQMSPDARPKGLLGKGGACAGLLTSTSFETFQACLHTAPDFGCDAPCPCHTAQPGERCYQTVVWVMNQGIAQRPDWYPGLGPGSSFEEIQDFLYRDGTGNSSCDER